MEDETAYEDDISEEKAQLPQPDMPNVNPRTPNLPDLPKAKRGPYLKGNPLRTEKGRKMFLNCLRYNGGNQSDARRRMGISHRSYYDYRERHPQFVKRVELAVEFGAVHHAEVIEGGLRTAEQMLLEVINSVEIDAANVKTKDVIEILKFLKGKEGKTVNKTVVNNTLNLENLSPAELGALLDIQEKAKATPVLELEPA